MENDFNAKVCSFVKHLQGFHCHLEMRDRIWDVIFPGDRSRFFHVRAVKDRETYYFHWIDGEASGLELTPKKVVNIVSYFGRSHEDETAILKRWYQLISDAEKWLQKVKKNWIKANRWIQEEYPLNRRKGLVPHALVRDSLADSYRLDNQLGKAKTKKIIDIIESGYFLYSDNDQCAAMTAESYFEYCKIGYIAAFKNNRKIDVSLSGREMYERYADGRDEGLLDIEPNSEQAFADWIDGKHPLRESGGHPWEIMPGGNTTHIDLTVTRPRYGFEKGFCITIRAGALHRLAEAINMFLALYNAKLPIGLSGAAMIRKRLLAQDNIGIIPTYDSLHRANQSFYEHQNVADVMYYDDLGRYKRRILPFIEWEALPLLRTK